jgi:uncharacterized protein (DUF58 family)
MRHFRILIPIAALLLLCFPFRLLQATGLFLMFLIIASWLLSVLPRRALRIDTGRRIIRGYLHETIELNLTVCNDSIFPIPLLAVKDETGGLHAGPGQVKVMHLPPRSQSEFRYTVSSGQRGLYRLGPIRLAAADPFGFFPWDSDWEEERLVFVYPVISELQLPVTHGQTGGPLSSHNPVFLDTTRIRSVRPYQSGDDPRFIHWPASARSGELQMKEFLRTLVVPCYVVLNLDEADFHLKRKTSHRERCIEAAAAFAHLAATRNYSLGFATNGKLPPETHAALGLDGFGQEVLHFPLEPAQTAASFILSSLSVIGMGGTGLAEVMANLDYHQRPRILIISPPLTPSTFNAICSLVPRGCDLDFWFLDEHVLREGRIGHQDAPPLPGIRLSKLPEYGDELRAGETAHEQ